MRNDGLDAEGKAPLPGLEICGTTVKVNGTDYVPGCLGDYPVVGIDEYGLWFDPFLAPLSRLLQIRVFK